MSNVNRSFLVSMGIEPSETNLEHLEVLVEAMKVYDARNGGKYQDLWKEYGLGTNFHHMDSKLRRVGVAGDPEDAVDLINYTAFWIRCFRSGGMGVPEERVTFSRRELFEFLGSLLPKGDEDCAPVAEQMTRWVEEHNIAR